MKQSLNQQLNKSAELEIKFKGSIDLNRIKEFKVLSSKRDKIYQVILLDKEWRCTCSNFKFRHTHCRHIKEIKKFIEDKTISYIEEEILEANTKAANKLISNNEEEYLFKITK